MSHAVYGWVADQLDAYALRLRAEAAEVPLGQGKAARLLEADRVAEAAALVRRLAGLPSLEAPDNRALMALVLRVHGFDVEVVDRLP